MSIFNRVPAKVKRVFNNSNGNNVGPNNNGNNSGQNNNSNNNKKTPSFMSFVIVTVIALLGISYLMSMTTASTTKEIS